MKAIRIDGQTPSGKRSLLADSVPMKTPYAVQIFPVYACNLACLYCIHSIPREKRNYVTDQVAMDYNVYQKSIDDLADFPQKLKMLRFAGTGEPLLHKDIVKMVSYAVEKKVADSIDIVTNGLLLTPELSLGLIDAGADKIRISIQGTSEKSYSSLGNLNSFEEFVDNLRFLYQHRQMTKIYIKIIDCALKDGEDAYFFSLFGDLCDFIAIEHVIPAVDQINYDELSPKRGMEVTQNGGQLLTAEVCPQPFYFMQINPDGKIVPCCAMETPYVAGDVNIESLREIWNSEKFNLFREKQLMKEKSDYLICKQCKQYRYAMFPEDRLDQSADKIIKIIRAKK